ncbi:uncharacterized protein LOC143481756 isoform X2 [Brachyhypopomus gauderio]|uniref:uncharacterized protein LOC143481756 isoform X2 n=1 Tax=Brachyhypopomus gauderio TaxID=698409 RepID=UPI0040427B13
MELSPLPVILLLTSLRVCPAEGKPKAVLSVSPQSWLTEGVSVTLSCEVKDSSTGWTFSWYRAVPYKEGLTPINDTKGYVMYGVDLLSDSSRGAGGSYTLSPAALQHTGVYVCRPERRESANQTEYSNLQPLWITGESPPVSLIIRPNRTQHFSGDSLTLSCEGQSDSTGWRVIRYRHSKRVRECSSKRGSEFTGSTCTIRFLYTSHTGVYWCQSESGGSSNPVNITVHNVSVILESPVHPVTERDPLTLHCLLRPTVTSDLRPDLYKDGLLIQNQTAGEMTIHTVSKSDEGLYHCKHPERGESPHSWVSVRVPLSSDASPPHVLVGLSVGLSLVLLFILLVLLWCYKTNKGVVCLCCSTGNQSDTSQTSDQTQRGSGDEAADDHSDVTYAQVMTHNKNRNKDVDAGPSDVTYTEVKMKPIKKPKKNQDKTRVGTDTVYSELRQDTHKGQRSNTYVTISEVPG